MKLSNFDFNLPEQLIAQKPIRPRDHSRLMVLNRKKNTIQHSKVSNLPEFFNSNDTLILNNSRVIPARLFAKKKTGGSAEIFLLHEKEKNIWITITKPGLKPNTQLHFLDKKQNVTTNEATVVHKEPDGITTIQFHFDLTTLLPKIGHTPLPPYITTPLEQQSWYQTIYAKQQGSVAAPTAGLHFTNRLLKKISEKGIDTEFVTLHVGLGTFSPVKTENISEHTMHSEYGIITEKTAAAANKTKGRIITVGTTSTRLVEHIGQQNNEKLIPFQGWINPFYYPPYTFTTVDAMLTNFHLPKSTLLMMISAFASLDFIKEAYQEAIKQQYRFYGFGDAMLII
ncbi:MAG: tRNA preQ1(34) S-adenosylmethionine ribosyltransferase-isomerase QueA [bacterium]